MTTQHRENRAIDPRIVTDPDLIYCSFNYPQVQEFLFSKFSKRENKPKLILGHPSSITQFVLKCQPTLSEFNQIQRIRRTYRETHNSQISAFYLLYFPRKSTLKFPDTTWLFHVSVIFLLPEPPPYTSCKKMLDVCFWGCRINFFP